MARKLGILLGMMIFLPTMVSGQNIQSGQDIQGMCSSISIFPQQNGQNGQNRGQSGGGQCVPVNQRQLMTPQTQAMSSSVSSSVSVEAKGKKIEKVKNEGKSIKSEKIIDEKMINFSFMETKIPETAVEAEEINDNTFIVRPERTTIVKMSASDINRITCSEGVDDEIKVIFPKRKGVNVKIVKNSVFVEFEVRKVGEEYKYQSVPVEFYIFCDSTLYNIIGFPQRIPAVTVYLDNKMEKYKKNLESLKDIPYEKRIIDIIKSIMTGENKMDAVYRKVDKKIEVFDSLEVKEIANWIFEAEGLIARVFSLSLKEKAGAERVDLKEKDFLKKELTIRPVAISLKNLSLRKGEKTLLVIVEKKPVLFLDEDFYGIGRN